LAGRTEDNLPTERIQALAEATKASTPLGLSRASKPIGYRNQSAGSIAGQPDEGQSGNIAWDRAAAAEFSRRLFPDSSAKRRQPAPRASRIDFERVHAWAFDSLDALLELVAPIGAEIMTPRGSLAWEGHHPDRRVIVCAFRSIVITDSIPS
jgi:hypothetical protein